MNNEVSVGDVLEFTRKKSYVNAIWETEDQVQGVFYIHGKTKILILEKCEKREKSGIYRILILTGEHTGKIGYEELSFLIRPDHYKKI